MATRSMIHRMALKTRQHVKTVVGKPSNCGTMPEPTVMGDNGSHSGPHRALSVVEVLENILACLPYHDLHFACYTCRHFQEVVNGDTRLRRKLFVSPKYNDLGTFLPVKIMSQWPTGYIFARARHLVTVQIFRLDDKRLLHLLKRPRLCVLDRLVAQPPLISLGVEVTFETSRIIPQKKIIYMRNQGGITLDDLVRHLKHGADCLPPRRSTQWIATGKLLDFEFADRP